jgi:hypothetical protein
MKRLLSILALAATGVIACAQGTTEAILGYTNSISSVVSSTAGWSFQPTATITVMNLGCFARVFDENPSAASIQVTLWDAGGALLRSGLITPGSTLVNNSRYESITPVALTAGAVYLLGVYSGGSLGLAVAGAAAGGTVSSSPEVQWRGMAVASSGGGFPPETTLSSLFVGPNFQYIRGGVPEPSSGLLLGIGAALFCARLGKRRG